MGETPETLEELLEMVDRNGGRLTIPGAVGTAMSKSSETYEISIAPEEWAAMLSEAGAPKNWADPDAAQRFASEITFRWPAAGKRKRNLYDRASDAIAELRRVLPKIIADDARYLAALDDPPTELQDHMNEMARAQTERQLNDLRRLFEALPELHWQLGKPGESPWHLDAAELYRLYLRYIDPKARLWNDAPAIHFIARALVRMGSRGPTTREDASRAERDTIVKALKRHLKRIEQARGRPDKSRMA